MKQRLRVFFSKIKRRSLYIYVSNFSDHGNQKNLLFGIVHLDAVLAGDKHAPGVAHVSALHDVTRLISLQFLHLQQAERVSCVESLQRTRKAEDFRKLHEFRSLTCLCDTEQSFVKEINKRTTKFMNWASENLALKKHLHLMMFCGKEKLQRHTLALFVVAVAANMYMCSCRSKLG